MPDAVLSFQKTQNFRNSYLQFAEFEMIFCTIKHQSK
uniref:Uncharacterized protein n=1 Tax=Arundo donax TaxID=35708 RepID=A0A0A9H1W2_ARUDO